MHNAVFIAHEYPALSQTFVVNEALGLELQGAKVSIFAINRRDSNPDPRLTIWGWRSIGHGGVLKEVPGVLAELLWNLPFVVRLVAHRPYSFRTAGRSAKAILLSIAVAALIRSERLPSVHIRGHFFGLMSQVALISARLIGDIPTTTSIMGHAGDVANTRSVSRLRAEVAAATFVTGASKFITNILDELDVPTPVHLLHCSVPVGRPVKFRPEVRPLGLITVCRLVPKKGLDTLIEAAALCIQDGQDLTVTIVGDGPEQDALRDLAIEHGVTDRVILLGARQPSEIPGLLRKSQGLFVLPCRRDSSGDTDGIPVALMEAMAQGLPVVSTRVGGIPELISDGVTGYLVPSSDAVALAAQIGEIYHLGERAAIIGMAGQRVVAADFSVGVVGERLSRLIHMY